MAKAASARTMTVCPRTWDRSMIGRRIFSHPSALWTSLPPVHFRLVHSPGHFPFVKLVAESVSDLELHEEDNAPRR
jgi:hypothetical protein